MNEHAQGPHSLKIGLIDSGIGGMSILTELLRLLPEADFEYLADGLFTPYGDLSAAKVRERTRECARFLIKRGCNPIVVACNTATALGIDGLRVEYPDLQFVGVEPFLNALNIHPKWREKGRVALLVTPGMAASDRLRSLKERTDDQDRVTTLAMPGLANLIEDLFTVDTLDDGRGVGTSSDEERPVKEDVLELLAKQLHPVMKASYEGLILGCTHYPLIKNSIEKMTGLEALCPSPFVAKRVKELLRVSFADSCFAGPSHPQDVLYHNTSRPRAIRLRRDLLLSSWPK